MLSGIRGLDIGEPTTFLRPIWSRALCGSALIWVAPIRIVTSLIVSYLLAKDLHTPVEIVVRQLVETAVGKVLESACVR